MRLTLAALLCSLPMASFAAGSDDTEPPEPTETTTKCTDAQVWDAKQQKCVSAQSGSLDNDTRFRAVRELAWAGQPEAALVVLDAMTEAAASDDPPYLLDYWRLNMVGERPAS